ncbi:MAG: small multi-drug export protein [Armatimonadota bacterium]|nr:MAG: small multi-drug export protein [Armatimonadota bacterium]
MSGLLSSTVDALRGLPPEYVVFIVSALPIFEIRGGVIAGILLGLPLKSVMVFGFLGNIASVTPILLFLEPLSKWLYGNRLADRLLHWLFARARRKADQINRWGPLGLMLFTAIPLPVSGAWTATLCSILLGVRRARAIASIYAGIIIAGIFVSILTLGGIAGVRTLSSAP